MKERFRNHSVGILTGAVQYFKPPIENELAPGKAALYLGEQRDQSCLLFLARFSFAGHDQVAVYGIEKKGAIAFLPQPAEMLFQQIFVPGGVGHIHHQAVPGGIYANRPFRFDTRHILAIARHFTERNVGKHEGIQIQQCGFLMRQNLARLNDNLIKMAQILDSAAGCHNKKRCHAVPAHQPRRQRWPRS